MLNKRTWQEHEARALFLNVGSIGTLNDLEFTFDVKSASIAVRPELLIMVRLYTVLT